MGGSDQLGGVRVTTTRDRHHGTVMTSAMWGCLTSLWVLLGGLVAAALLRWAL